MKRRGFSEGWAKAVAVALVIGAIVVPVIAVNAANSQPRDDNANSVIWGGCYSLSECFDKFNNGDGHGHSGANITASEALVGVSKSGLSSNATVRGTVFKDGHVTINQNFGTFKAGDTVATNSWSLGRDRQATSTPFGPLWKTFNNGVFLSNSIPAFVNMQGGTMQWFMLNSCGNPGKGNAVPAPKPPKSPTPTPKTPTPKPPTPTPPTPTPPTPTPPTPTPPTPTPPTPVPPTPSPVTFACSKMLFSQPDQSNLSLFQFTITPEVSDGVAVTGYLFRFSDQNFAANQTGPDMPSFARVLPPGQNTVEGQVETTAGTTDISQSCTVTVNAPQTPGTPSPLPPTPSPTGQVLGTQAPLPATGPETALGGVAGVTAIGMAGRAYLRSRKNLLDSLRKRNRK